MQYYISRLLLIIRKKLESPPGSYYYKLGVQAIILGAPTGKNINKYMLNSINFKIVTLGAQPMMSCTNLNIMLTYSLKHKATNNYCLQAGHLSGQGLVLT